MVLELQRLLSASGVQPVRDEPVFVAVGVTGTAGGQDVRQPASRGQRNADVLLPMQMGVVAGNQQRFADDVGGREGVIVASQGTLLAGSLVG